MKKFEAIIGSIALLACILQLMLISGGAELLMLHSLSCQYFTIYLDLSSVYIQTRLI